VLVCVVCDGDGGGGGCGVWLWCFVVFLCVLCGVVVCVVCFWCVLVCVFGVCVLVCGVCVWCCAWCWCYRCPWREKGVNVCVVGSLCSTGQQLGPNPVAVLVFVVINLCQLSPAVVW